MPPPRDPNLAGKPVSLYLLFERVTKLGGSHTLSQEDKWQDILQAFNLTPPSATLAYGLRKIYKQYLESFERLQLYGEDPADDDEEEQNPNRGALDFLSEPRKVREDSYSQSYDRHVRRRMFQEQASSFDPNFQSLYKPDPPEWKIINSLHSCLPNEVNFILNTLLLYCSDHRQKRLRLERCPHLLDALMLHVGVPEDHDCELSQRWQANSKLFLTHYWDEVLSENDDLKPLLGIYSDFIPPHLKSEEPFLLGEKDREGQRIRQVLVILRNIVQDRLDTHIIRRNERVFCFLLRCALSSENTGLIEQALETLSMLLESDKTDKNVQLPVWIDEPYMSLILEMLVRLMRRSDKVIQIRVLEIYSSLLEQTVYDNGKEYEETPDPAEEETQTLETLQKKAELLLEYLPDMSEMIIPNLTLPDCDLLVATLEALVAIARSPMARSMVKAENIAVLVDLLSFSSRNCDFSKLKFFGPRHGEVTHYPLIVTPRLPRLLRATSAPLQGANSSAPNSQKPQAQTPHPATPHNSVHSSPAKQAALRPQQQEVHSNATKSQTPQKLRPVGQVANGLKEDQSQIQAASANFARAFIRKRIELGDENELLSRSGVFTEYTTKATQELKIAGVNGTPVLDVSGFTRLVREIFPTTQVLNDSHNRQSFVGIRMKKGDFKDEPIVPPISNGHATSPSPSSNGNSTPSNGVASPISNGVANGISEVDEDSVGGGVGKVKPKMEPKLEPIPEKTVNGTSSQEKEASAVLQSKSQSEAEKALPVENGSESHSDKENDESQKKESLQKNGTPVNGKLLPQKRTTEEGAAKTEPNQPVAKRVMIAAGPPQPPAGLRVLLQNAGHFLFDDFTDDREDCLTRAVRINAATILLCLTEQSVSHGEKDIVPMISRFEDRLSLMAASRQDASPVLARLLAFIP
ncbi:Oidioi.mRNA.OKI2018_I69.chr1.g3725.t1.cds [Oikopleura dioica]|uniref:Oidioi.mRNA.OKI2018_I69.chr1.g3725.t1.cds n=1 Tax=Oikopleura dioica TaxID=34765 RepID=A0ABN7SZB5_OIKDI|nr:Oidioi.mRNA.OKI2018_I69.chr1.g3725.t1.cds [Oikopleura dioica]